MTIVWRYFHTWFFTFRRDGLEQSGLPVTWTPSFLKLCISQNPVFQDQDIFPKNRPKIIKKNSRGCALHPSLRGCTPPIPQGWILVACLHLYLMTLTLHLAASHLTPQRVGCIMEYSLAACVRDCRQQQYGAHYITIPDYKSGWLCKKKIHLCLKRSRHQIDLFDTSKRWTTWQNLRDNIYVMLIVRCL